MSRTSSINVGYCGCIVYLDRPPCYRKLFEVFVNGKFNKGVMYLRYLSGVLGTRYILSFSSVCLRLTKENQQLSCKSGSQCCMWLVTLVDETSRYYTNIGDNVHVYKEQVKWLSAKRIYGKETQISTTQPTIYSSIVITGRGIKSDEIMHTNWPETDWKLPN